MTNLVGSGRELCLSAFCRLVKGKSKGVLRARRDLPSRLTRLRRRMLRLIADLGEEALPVFLVAAVAFFEVFEDALEVGVAV